MTVMAPFPMAFNMTILMRPIDEESAELLEALRVQAMPDIQRSAWLRDVWGKVQRSSAAFLVNAPEQVPTARSYATLDEKNRFDEARELAFAMHHSVYARQEAGHEARHEARQKT